MLEFASMSRSKRIALQRALRGTAPAFAMGVALWATSIQVMAETSATGKIPALAGNGLGWISVGGFLDPPPGTGHGPMKQDPAHPFHGNLVLPSASTSSPNMPRVALTLWRTPLLSVVESSATN
jgi:hypothetical protein